MKVENQVCTLEQGIKLFNYSIANSAMKHVSLKEGAYKGVYLTESTVPEMINIPAFSVAELGCMLPNHLSDETAFESEIFNDVVLCCYAGKKITKGKTEAEARAAMLIYLLENNLTTPEEVNNRLKP